MEVCFSSNVCEGLANLKGLSHPRLPMPLCLQPSKPLPPGWCTVRIFCAGHLFAGAGSSCSDVRSRRKADWQGEALAFEGIPWEHMCQRFCTYSYRKFLACFAGIHGECAANIRALKWNYMAPLWEYEVLVLVPVALKVPRALWGLAAFRA